MRRFSRNGLAALLSVSFTSCVHFNGPRHFDFYENAPSAVKTIKTDLTGDGIPETIVVSYDLNGDGIEDVWAFFPTRYNERGIPGISSRAEIMFLDVNGDRDLDYMISDVNRDGRFEISESCEEVLRRGGYLAEVIRSIGPITENQ